MKKAYLVYLWDSKSYKILAPIKVYSSLEKAEKERSQREDQLFYTHPNWHCFIDELPFEE